MHRNFLIFALGTLPLCTVANAAPAAHHMPKWYAGLSGHVSFLSDAALETGSIGSIDFDSGIGGTASLGYMPEMFNTASGDVRVEVEGGYHIYSIDNSTINAVSIASRGHFRYQTAMANVYYDMKNSTAWTPYIGGGAGAAFTSLSDSSAGTDENQTQTRFAWQLMTGVTYAPSWLPNADVALGYRYFNIGSPDYLIDGNQTKLDTLYAHNAELGAHYHF